MSKPSPTGQGTAKQSDSSQTNREQQAVLDAQKAAADAALQTQLQKQAQAALDAKIRSLSEEAAYWATQVQISEGRISQLRDTLDRLAANGMGQSSVANENRAALTAEMQNHADMVAKRDAAQAALQQVRGY